jgi:bifunctional non-homologous end joining protein LigD
MSLSLYKKKRHFNETPEPEGKQKSSKGILRFVIQKHDASHVHYDFRLEMEGVLKSWAVPKGPSLNPADKRLAMQVEDHPYDYRNFEGVIPAGNYGSGTVIVWDEGTYEPTDAEGLSRKEQEKLLLKQLHSGNLKIRMHGKKIKGDYALFQMKAREERSWILVKKNDEFASEEDITENEKSVKSGKTLVDVAEEHGTTVNHPEAHGKGARSKAKRPGKQKPIQLLKEEERTASKKTASGKSGQSSSKSSKPAGKKKARSSIKEVLGESFSLTKESAMPTDVIPMLATLVNEPFDNDNWIFEIKWDGYRALAYCNGKDVELISRNLKSFTEKYYPVTDAFRRLKFNAVFDGEVVAVNEKGLAVFQTLQNWQNTPVRLQYFIFDILWLEGYDLTRIPLIERKRILKEVLPEDDEVLKYSDHVVGKGKEFFQAAVSQGLEGIMAKKSSSIYQTDKRTENWVKIKVNLRQEVVIAGYTAPRKSRKFFGSLLLGLYDHDRFVYVGHTGSGFNSESLERIYEKLQPLKTDKCPFEKCPKGNMPVTWVKPKLVCEIKFAEWTKDGIARQPIFMGLREDKKAKDVMFEKSISPDKIKEDTKEEEQQIRRKRSGAREKERIHQRKAPDYKPQAAGKKAASRKSTAKKSSKPSSRQPVKSSPKKLSKSTIRKSGQPVIDLRAGEDQQLVLDGHELKLTHLNKLYWKKESFSKGDTINYYLRIAPYILPYMLDRPQSLNRHPNGINAPNFFQKDQKGKVPGWMQTHKDFSESTNETIEYLVCSNEATLIYMANLGCIEMNPWHSRSQSWQYPDWCLIDLDPDKSNTFEQVMEVAKVVKQVLDSIGAEACVKTSGSTGIHIYVPLGARYDYDQSKEFAELVVTLVNYELPELTSVERSPSKRKGKIYLDFLQNRQTQTAAAPYSLRPKPGVPVSTPLHWSELKKGLTPTTYNAHTIFDRLKAEGDLFKPVLGKGVDLEKVLSKLASQMGTGG